MRILAVDDNPNITQMVAKFFRLKKGDYGVDIASSGKEALSKYRTYKPDVVILDITMPEMDGIETLTKLMIMDPTASVIMASAAGTSEIIDQCLKKGAKGFVEKPFAPDELLTIINNVAKSGTSGKDLVTVFSLAGNKMELSFRKLSDREFTMKLKGVKMNEFKELSKATHFNPDTTFGAEQTPDKTDMEKIEVPDTAFGFSSEISGQTSGVIVGVVDKKDLYALCGKEFLEIITPKDKNDFLEIFNILNNNIITQISVFMGGKIRLSPVRHFDSDTDNEYGAKRLFVANYDLSLEDEHYPIDFYLWL